MRGAVWRVLALALALGGAPDAAPAQGAARGIAVTAAPVTLTPDRLAPGMRIAGAWHLTSPDPAFGGFSGLLVEGERLTAVGDRGVWLTGRIALAEPPVTALSLAPLRGAEGSPLTGAAADAEGLARHKVGLVVSFERDHRLHVWRDGRAGPALRPKGASALPLNAGMEALAGLAEGGLLAIAEGRAGDGFPLWLIARDGAVTRASLPAISRHAVTGADLGPDGRLYLVLRHWSRATGISVRVMVYDLGADGLPVAESAAVLAAFGRDSGIDNMEGIAAVPDGQGGVVLWLLADDNFNPPQRTILAALALAR